MTSLYMWADPLPFKVGLAQFALVYVWEWNEKESEGSVGFVKCPEKQII